MTKINKEKDDARSSYEMVKKYYDQKHTLGELTAGKCKAKTAFTKARHELIRLLKQSPSYHDVQTLQLRLHEFQQLVLSVLANLASEYKTSEYKQCWKNTLRESESVKEEYDEANRMAEEYLGRTSSRLGSRSVSQDTLPTQPDGVVTEDVCREVRLNDVRVQDLYFDFSKLDMEDYQNDENKTRSDPNLRKVNRNTNRKDLTSRKEETTGNYFRTEERKSNENGHPYETGWKIKPSLMKGRMQSSGDDSTFVDIGNRIKLKNVETSTYHPQGFEQNIRVKKNGDSNRGRPHVVEEPVIERQTRPRRNRLVNSNALPRKTRDKGGRERALSWDSSTLEGEKRINDVRKRIRTNSANDRIKQEWLQDSLKTNGVRLASKRLDSSNWKVRNGDGDDSPFEYKGLDKYQEVHRRSMYTPKDTTTKESDETSRRNLRKNVSFGGFDFKNEFHRDAGKYKSNLIGHDYEPETLISVIENTKSFHRYKKVRNKLLEVLGEPRTRRNKIRELQEMMKSYYNKLQDDIHILSEEYNRDIKAHKHEMMSTFDKAQAYLDARKNNLGPTEGTNSFRDTTSKVYPEKRNKKVKRASYTTDDLSCEWSQRF